MSIWAAIPGSLKRFVGYGVASGIAMSMVLAMYLFWGTGYLQDRLGVVVTKGDLQEQTDKLADGSKELVREVAQEVVTEYDSMLRGYMDQERQLAKDTILFPIVKSIRDLDANVRSLARAQAHMSGRMSELPSVMDEKLLEMLNAMPPTASPAQIEELTRLVRQQQDELELLREEVKSGRRTTKGRF